MGAQDEDGRPQLTHLDAAGRVRMVDVGAKPVTRREAVVAGSVRMKPSTLALIREGRVKKGEVLVTARLAGVMAAKRTWELIPLCHPIQLSSVAVELSCEDAPARVEIRATARAGDRTGVEMEALTAASVAALTIYDMCKAVDRGMVIEGVRLLAKSGGRSGDWRADEAPTTSAGGDS